VWLGLAAVYRIVELHGGRLFASSAGPGMGSVFTARLPLQVAQARLPQRDSEVVSGPFRSNGRIFASQRQSTRK
jgi:hypothetical protein